MYCIKTGFNAEFNGQYLHGDAYAFSDGTYNSEENLWPKDDLLLRIVTSTKEKPAHIHIRLTSFQFWFERYTGYMLEESETMLWRPNSTLIANPGQWEWLGYIGVEV